MSSYYPLLLQVKSSGSSRGRDIELLKALRVPDRPSHTNIDVLGLTLRDVEDLLDRRDGLVPFGVGHVGMPGMVHRVEKLH